MSVILNPFQLLELNIISAQDLASVARSMRTYTVAWVHPDRRLSTRVDANGRNNPTWNDKFVFRVDEDFLNSETSAIVIEIYAVHWLKDVPVGTVRVLVNNVVPLQPSSHRFRHNHDAAGMQFVALQVRRPSGRPQGILNIGVSVLNSSMRSMPLYSQLSASAVGVRDLLDKKQQNKKQNQKDQDQDLLLDANKQQVLRRTKSDLSTLVGSKVKVALKRKVSIRQKATSLINASDVVASSPYQIMLKKKVGGGGGGSSTVVNNGLDGEGKKGGVNNNNNNNNNNKVKRSGGNNKFITDSELGPSPSEVAVELARKERQRPDPDAESSIIAWSVNADSVEGLQSKLERWRAEVPAIYDNRGSYEPASGSIINGGNDHGHGRRHTDGGSGDGLFSCFSNVCGCQCSISIGKPSKKSGKRSGRRRRSQSPDSASYVV